MAEISTRLRSGLLAGAAIGLLASGCASTTASRPPRPEMAPVSARQPSGEKLHVELIEQLLESGRPFAALAHLDALEPSVAAQTEARLLRGETLRHVGNAQEAAEVYRSLLGTDAAALARRGLGLLAAEAGELDEAIPHFRHARRLRPTDPRIRNDLGYALLLRGEFDEARTELVTAVELGDRTRAARNLLLLLLIEGEGDAAGGVAGRHGIDAAELGRLRRDAETLRSEFELGGGA